MPISKETFRVLIKEGQELIKEVELYERPFEFEDVGRHVLVGIRQAGKSYMLYLRARQLMAREHRAEEFLYVDFDDERLLEMTADDFDVMLQAYLGTYDLKPILLLDEVQNVQGWEHFARRMANQKYSVYITGSNAKLLSRDIYSTLGGRYVADFVYPYSFAEYLGARGVNPGDGWEYGRERFVVEQMFGEYLRRGGFPELLLYKDKRRWLNDVYEKILLNDIALRNNVRNERALRMTIMRLAESIGKPISYTRISNLINSAGVSTTPASVSQYVQASRDACFVFSLENHASKFVERETIKKHYLADNGLVSVFMPDSYGALLENAVACHLSRKYGSGLYYYKKNIEVDFYVPAEKYAVQACANLLDADTVERELKALESLDALYGLELMQIATLGDEGLLKLPNGKEVKALPAWRIFLE